MPPERSHSARPSSTFVGQGLRVLDELEAENVDEEPNGSALNGARTSNELAVKAERVDLILGSNNRDRSPYGTTFNDVCAKVARAEVHELTGQGHMVHLEAPAALTALLHQLRAANGAPRSGE